MFKTAAAVSVLFALSAACSSTATCCKNAPCPNTQAIVLELAQENADVVRLSVHAIPPGKSQMIAIASTSTEKLGKPSDQEDLDAVSSGQNVVLHEGDNVDVTVPILAFEGKYTAAVGATMKAADQQAGVEAALVLAAKIETRMMADIKRQK